MSQENVEIVRTSYEVWNAGDMDAYRELYDPDAVVRPPEGWPEPGPFFGREEAMRWCAQIREAWDADTAETISDFIDAADRVVVRWIWHGAGQGPEAKMEMTAVFTVRKGRILGLEFFWDHAEALETLGLSEQPMSPQAMEDAVRQIVEAVNSKDLAALQAASDPEGEFTSRLSVLDGRTYRGHAGLSDYLADLEAAWEHLEGTIEESMPAGDETLMAVLRSKGVSRGSGASFDQRIYCAYEFRRGKAWRTRFYFTREEALEAVGLSEPPPDGGSAS